MRREESRRNIRLGMILFITALIMFGGAFAWAFVYEGLR
jgi:heme/copper-type cytochrome/quinol oxidase subunit 3